MDRDEFMELVYETFADEPDNVLANGIIEAADAYVEHEKAQLSKECTTSDFPEPTRIISETRAIPSDDDRVSLSEMVTATFYDDGYEEWSQKTVTVRDVLDAVCDEYTVLPPAQPEAQEGHWIDKGWNGDWAWQIDGRGNCWRVIECSECGKSVSVESNYCPNCGAKMSNQNKIKGE